MDNILQNMSNWRKVFDIAKDSIGVLNSSELGIKLKNVDSVAHKDLPNWITESIVPPDPIIETASVNRYDINVPAASPAFIEIHEIDKFVKYAKIYFVFTITRVFRNYYYSKKIDTVMNQSFGSPDMKISSILRNVVGKNFLAYTPGNVVVLTNNSVAHISKEFQIHIYDPVLFAFTHDQLI